MQFVYYRTLLNEKEKKIYDKIFEDLMHFQKEIVINGTDHLTVDKILNHIRFDWPELFFVSFEILFSYTDNYVKLTVPYLMDQDEAAAKLRRLNAEADRIVSYIKGKTAYEKALWIHDYLARVVFYEKYETKSDELHSIVGGLFNHKCVCDGFSKSFQYLCDRAGIPSFMVVGHGINKDGTKENHAWNMVKIEGKNYFVDVTYDISDNERYCSRAYFMLSTEEILQDHIPDGEYILPYCPDSMCPLPVVDSVDKLKRLLKNEVHMNKVASEVRFASPVEKETFFKAFEKSIKINEIGVFNRIKRYTFSDTEFINTVAFFWQ